MRRSAAGTGRRGAALGAMGETTSNILEKPIQRIRETCELIGASAKFDRSLPALEAFLEGELAAGETSETRLTYDGLCFLKDAFSKA